MSDIDELTYWCQDGEHWDHEDNGSPVYVGGERCCPECFKSAAGRCKNCDELMDDEHMCELEVAA